MINLKTSQNLLYSLLIILCSFSISFAEPFPIEEDITDRQGRIAPDQDYRPGGPLNHPAERSMNPNLTRKLNEPHPFPEYMKKFIWKGDKPHYYHQLLMLEPVDQVQSKVFDPKKFRMARRIGVVGFENKTQGRFKDEGVGKLIANKISRGLEGTPNYRIIHPTQMVDEYRFEIVAKRTPLKQKGQVGSSSSVKKTDPSREEIVYDLPYSNDKIDAVMIGAVSRYDDTYIDRLGNRQKAHSGGVEFGAYLISTKTGDVLWAARFVGSQSATINNLFNGKRHWLSREELAQFAIEHVLRAFHSQDQ
ncbi:MAG: hypothetical protein ACQ9MH_03255 [Nitrospinales bacterium]